MLCVSIIKMIESYMSGKYNNGNVNRSVNSSCKNGSKGLPFLSQHVCYPFYCSLKVFYIFLKILYTNVHGNLIYNSSILEKSRYPYHVNGLKICNAFIPWKTAH